MKTSGQITAEQMLNELSELKTDVEPEPDDGAKTIQEWASAWGMDRFKASDLIRAGLDGGKVGRVVRRRKLADGRTRRTTCYRWVG